MKTSFWSFCLIASFAVLFTQCKKDDNPTPTTSTNYSPLTTGSNWTYNYSESGGSPETIKLTVTDRDTSINGKTYKVLSSSDNSGDNYLAKIDSNYYRFTTFPGIGDFEELYLKDNRAVNSTWTNSVPFTLPGTGSFNADLTYTVKEVGISRTVNGKEYKDVIHVAVAVNVTLLNFGGGDFYYANNVGLIESSISLTPPAQPVYSSTQQLVSYEIK